MEKSASSSTKQENETKEKILYLKLTVASRRRCVVYNIVM